MTEILQALVSTPVYLLAGVVALLVVWALYILSVALGGAR